MPQPRTAAELLDRLAAAPGVGQVLRDPAMMDAFIREPRGRFDKLPLAVVRPADSASVAAVVRLCRGAGVAIVTRGGGSGTVGGASMIGDGPELLLSLDRLRTIERIDPAAATMTAGAGAVLDRLRDAAAEHDLDVPLWLASGGTATLGGVLATNAGGNTTIRHGNARRMALGLEAVLADGRVLNLLSGLRKDNAGFDLIDLLIGSEGTLGIITRATIALVPRPRQQLTLWCALDSPHAALSLLARARTQLGETLSAFELISRQALALALAHLPDASAPPVGDPDWHVLIQADSSIAGNWLAPAGHGLLEQAMADDVVRDAVVATGAGQAGRLWALREAISPAQKAIGASIKHDISIPVEAIPEMIEATLADLRARIPDLRPCLFGHVGDGNLHFNLSRPADWSDAAFMQRESEINRIVFDRVQALGGSIAAEHGIGQLRAAELGRRIDPVRLDLMRRIKQALDPDGLLNPGKAIGSERC